MQFLEQTILAQYANSPILKSYLQSINAAIDPITIINDFYNNVWNVSTATGYGLDVWGRIVGVDRILMIDGGDFFGFDEAEPSGFGFGQAPFFHNQNATNSYILTDDAFRLLILIKALSNISASASYNYNKILMQLFPNRGNAYITHVDTMQSRLVFEFQLQPFEIAILRDSGALSPPTGVNFDIMIISLPNVFGFAEAGNMMAPFGHGAFFAGYA
jgi:hypothetical protein